MPHARLTDPISSHEAASRVSAERLTQTQEIIIKLLAEGMTDEELVNAYQAYCRMSGISNVSSPMIARRVPVANTARGAFRLFTLLPFCVCGVAW